MTAFWTGFSVLLFWAASLTIVSVWSRKDTWGRSVMVMLFALSVPFLFIVFGASLGNPRPISWEQLLQKKDVMHRLLGHKMIYEVGIYLLLDTEGQPVYLELSWNTGVAEDLQTALREAGEEGEVFVEIPYEKSLDDNPPQFHAKPQPKFLPEKAPPQEPPVEYERNG